MSKPISLTCAALTDRGRERKLNEDCFSVFQFTASSHSRPVSGGVFTVSDGMGGHNAGEIASLVAIRQVSSFLNARYVQKLTDQSLFEFPDYVYNYHFRKKTTITRTPKEIPLLKRAFQMANAEIIELSRRNPAFYGMGATLTTAILLEDRLTVASIGDSRCYCVNGGRLQQITRDHTIVTQMVESGKISQAEALRHPGKNFLYKSLGSDDNIELDLFERRLKPPAWLLLCSDGLNNMVPDAEIENVLRRTHHPQLAARKLIQLANGAGGKDNISVIVVKLTC